MAGGGVGADCRILWDEVMGTGLGGGLLCVRFVGNMVTCSGIAGGVSVGTLRDGARKYVWSAPVGASRGVFGVTVVQGVSMTYEKMRKSVCMAENLSLHSVAKGGWSWV